MHASHFITQIIKKTDSQELRYGNTNESYFFIKITFKEDFFKQGMYDNDQSNDYW